MTNKEKCFHFLTETAALSRAVAIGIMANIRHESNFEPTAKGDSGTSYGLCQWHKNRWDRLRTFCNDNGYNIKDVEPQLRFLLWEFRKYYHEAWDDLSEQDNTVHGAAEVAYIMCVKYEIPANKEASGKKRGETARKLWEEFSTVSSGNVDKPAQEEKPIGVQPTWAKVRKASYRIKKGDTLTSIAWSFRTTVGDILAVNPAIEDKNKIYEGQTIKIPGRMG